jgi:hypothetical protein
MLLGLSIALEHPALSTDPRILCTAARACNAWREAVQQCQVRSTAVVFHPEATLQSWWPSMALDNIISRFPTGS